MKSKLSQKTIAWAVYIALVLAVACMSSCTTPRHGNGYQDHLKTTPQRNFVVVDNGGCGWNR